jgi:hypothetical protein
MLKDMPIGNMIKSTDTNLDNYFGFWGVVVVQFEKVTFLSRSMFSIWECLLPYF